MCACAPCSAAVHFLKNREKNPESILCVFSGGSTTRNFVQFSFLLIVEVPQQRRRQHTCSIRLRRQQSKSMDFSIRFSGLSCDWNEFIHLATWARSQIQSEKEKDRYFVMWTCVPYVVRCVPHEPSSTKKPCEFYSQLIKLFFALRNGCGCDTPRSFRKQQNGHRMRRMWYLKDTIARTPSGVGFPTHSIFTLVINKMNRPQQGKAQRHKRTANANHDNDDDDGQKPN